MLINTNNYKYVVYYSSVFKKHYKNIKKQGKDILKLRQVINKIANGEVLEAKYKNHKLTNDKRYKDCFECHIEPDWLLIYQYKENELILLLISTGSHSELFK